MKIALVQFSPVLNNLSATLIILKPLLEKCKDADIVILPELANSGYNFKSEKEAFQCAESVDSSVFIDELKIYCERFNFSIATGFCEIENDKLYNTAIFFNHKQVFLKYRKLHLFMNEKNIFHKGDLNLPICDFMGTRIAFLICFDWMFPEVWRTLALRGVDFIIHPSNLVLEYAQKVIPSYCIVNKIYVATVNRIGTENDLTFTGNSIFIDPKGSNLVNFSKKTDVQIVDVELNTARDKNVTIMNNAFTDRRTDIY